MAAAVGLVAALLPFCWLLTAGSFDLLAPQPRAADFHEAQARSWLEGRWALEPGVLGIEAFEIDGEEQTYFGVMPTLLRVPVVAVTDTLDGRLTQLSMVAAVAVIGASATSLGWAARWAVRGARPVDRRDLVLAAATPFVVVAGSIVLYLAGRAWVYHEALLWGSAWALVSAAALVRHLAGGSLISLGVASAAAVAALHTRASVGAGAVVALALVGAAELAVTGMTAWRARRTPMEQPRRTVPWGDRPWRLAGGGWPVVAVLAVTGVLAVGSYVAINLVRFGEPLRLPLEAQTYVRLSEERQQVLADNDGSLFGPQFVPTTALQYLRPDGLALDRTYPFIGFRDDVDVVGDVSFDTLDPSASIPSSMPLFAVGGVGGLVALAGAWRRRDPLRTMALPALGLAGSAVGILIIGYVAHRYLGDVLPFAVVTSLAAVHVAVDQAAGRGRRVVGVSALGLVVLAGWGVAANGALGVLYQRQEAPDVPERLRGALVEDQLSAARWVPGAAPPRPRWVETLPDRAEDGELVALRDCRGVYWGTGERWAGVERSEEAGGWTLEVRWPEDAAPGQLWPLLGSGGRDGANVLVAELADGQVRVGYLWDDPQGRRHAELGRPVPVGATSSLEVVFDPVTVEIRVEVDRRLAYEGYRFYPRVGAEAGRSDAGGRVRSRLPGVEVRPRDTELCEALRSRG